MATLQKTVPASVVSGVTGELSNRVCVTKTQQAYIKFDNIDIVQGILRMYTYVRRTQEQMDNNTMTINGMMTYAALNTEKDYTVTPDGQGGFTILGYDNDSKIFIYDLTSIHTPTFTYTTKQPEVGDFTVNGTNTDENIVCTANLVDITWWKVEAIQNGAVVASKTGLSTAVSCTFAPGEIKGVGTTTFKLTAYYNANEATATKDVTLTKVMPVIVALEPNGVNQDKDTDITVSWNATNQHSFILVVDGKTYTGATGKSIVLPKGTFTSLKTVNMSLTITYTSSWGDVRTATKSASFLLVGKPNTPVLEQKTTYTNALPIFNWTCIDAYVQYHLEVLKGSTAVFNSGDVVSSATSCQCTTALENNTTYTVKVKVKTQFGYWSDFGANAFNTNFSVANLPNVQLFATGNGILVNSNTTYSDNFSSCELYRKTDNTDWTRIGYNFGNVFSYTDNFVGAGTYYYKVTSISTTGGKNESEVVSIATTISNFNFANVEDVNNGVELVGNPNISITQNRQVSTNLYSGCYAPVVETGIQNYKSGSASFTVRKNAYDKLMKVINGSKVLLYRDRRGEKFYCCITSNMSKKYDVGDTYNISFSFVEVPFLEKDMYRGDGTAQNVIFFDGTYMFDGAINFSGEV